MTRGLITLKSAGGHLAGNISTFTEDYSAIGDSLDETEVRPNFQVLVSAALSFKEYGHKGSRDALLGEVQSEDLTDKFSNELNVTDSVPVAFIVHASDDPVVNPMNSILYYQALRSHNIDAWLHIFPHGGHSIALRNNPGSSNLWIALCEAWLKEMGFL